MKRIIVVALVASISWGSQGAELPLKRVVLSTSGLAQFTYSGEGSPGSTIDLAVRVDQVDDLLKSLTIFDREGAIGAVSLPGQSPLTELFRDLPFGPEALNSPTALLNALVGTEVEIEGQVGARGRIFRVEDEQVQLPDDGGQALRHRLTLLTDKGLVQAVIEELSALRFTDAQARAQIDRALAGLAQNHAKERRTLSIGLLGQGTRPVGFSYVVAAPVWKTGYRLVLPKEGGKARLQGWGVIENLTGSDWKDVELSLVSGNPVALKQSLYSPFFVDRPEIPVSAAVRLVPRKDEIQVGAQNLAMRNRAAGSARSLEALPLLKQQAQNNVDGRFDRAANAPQPPSEELGGAALAVDSEDAATQVIFRFPAKISLASSSTMMVPFIDRDIGATRTFLYQPETNAKRPLAAVRLQNDGDTALPAGIITAFDMGADGSANFAGDAQLPLMPKGSFKFVTFALDSKTDIRRVDHGIKETRLGKAVRGELTLTVKSRWDIDYEITPPANEDRDIVIDESRQDGWKATGDSKDIEETANRLRYKVFAPKSQTTKATLSREHVEHQHIVLTTLEPERMLATVSGLENESAGLKDTVARLSALVAEINAAHSRRVELEAERKKIGEDQERIRRNLSAVGQSSDLGRRYLDTLRMQEDRLIAIAAEDKSIGAQLTAKKRSAEDIARSLAL